MLKKNCWFHDILVLMKECHKPIRQKNRFLYNLCYRLPGSKKPRSSGRVAWLRYGYYGFFCEIIFNRFIPQMKGTEKISVRLHFISIKKFLYTRMHTIKLTNKDNTNIPVMIMTKAAPFSRKIFHPDRPVMCCVFRWRNKNSIPDSIFSCADIIFKT